jgi:hypothetical protein
MKMREPGGSGINLRLMIFIRRANLDALWSREPGTVHGNLGLAQRLGVEAATLGIDFLPPLTNAAPIKDVFGMNVAVLMLSRSLAPGCNRATVQFNMARKIRSVHSNYVQANLGYRDESVMAKDDKKLYTMDAVTYGCWFERFTRGCHSRMGNQPQPYRAPLVDELKVLLEYLEVKYYAATNHMGEQNTQLLLACVGIYVTSGFLGSLRRKRFS